MAQTEKGFTKGLEKLEFLTDKTARLVFQLEAEELHVKELRNELRQLRGKGKEIKVLNEDLEKKLERLEKEGVMINSKVEGLLEAINGLAPE